jgi:2-deoxy-D-gluconate 3-dehydrogenase
MNRDPWKTEAGRGQIASMPRRRMPQPEVMDGMLPLLASEKSDYITGTLIPVDDGQVLM